MLTFTLFTVIVTALRTVFWDVFFGEKGTFYHSNISCLVAIQFLMVCIETEIEVRLVIFLEPSVFHAKLCVVQRAYGIH